jgi:hypothetical protein
MVSSDDYDNDPGANEGGEAQKKNPARLTPIQVQGQAAQQARKGRVGRGQSAQQPQYPDPVLPPQPVPAALDWLAGAAGFLYQKPQAPTRLENEITDPYRGRQLRLEFIAGSRRGRAGQPIVETPAVRLTAGGRPVARAQIDFEVSQGKLDGAATTTRLVTDAVGIARIPAWTLGEAALHSIVAEHSSLREERTVLVC